MRSALRFACRLSVRCSFPLGLLGLLGACGGSISVPTGDAAIGADAADAADGGGGCGGKAGLACPADQWCAYAEGTCLNPDEAGTCRKREALPCVAPQPGDEVCGCDGKTYQSTCVATSAGMSVARAGACETVPKICGGLTGASCGATEYCDWGALPNVCGGDDSTGTCKARPAACVPSDGIYCGCDGKVYESTCAAALAGQGTRKNGPC